MTGKEKNILDVLQKKIPLAEKPYAEIAKLLKIDESELIKKIKDLKRRKFIKYIGAIINTAALNYKSALVAFYVSPKNISNAARIINSHPGVSHNYLRDSRDHNIWFTIAVPKGTNLVKTTKQPARLCFAEKSLFLPSIKTYKVKMVLDLGNTAQQKPQLKQQNNTAHFLPGKLSKNQKLILSYLQYGLLVESETFKKIAEKTGLSTADVLKISKELLAKGYIKRFGTIVSHTKTGYKVNCLVLWNAPLSKIDACGKILSSSKNISHCYRRRSYPDWPYSIYTMIHAKNEKGFQFILKEGGCQPGVQSSSSVW